MDVRWKIINGVLTLVFAMPRLACWRPATLELIALCGDVMINQLDRAEHLREQD